MDFKKSSSAFNPGRLNDCSKCIGQSGRTEISDCEFYVLFV